MLPNCLNIIEKLLDVDGCILFPEDLTFEVLDNKDTVRVGNMTRRGTRALMALPKRESASSRLGDTPAKSVVRAQHLMGPAYEYPSIHAL
jgi:hypothetical protein